MATTYSINVNYNGTNSFVPAAPTQRSFALDTTNPKYLRNATLTQDCLRLQVYTASVVIPLTQLYAAAVSASSNLTWPPVVITQPTGSTVPILTNVTLSLSASAETSINYQWYYQTGSNWNTSSATGNKTPTLTIANARPANDTINHLCLLSNISGITSSSMAVFNFTPIITTQPTSSTVNHTGSAYFRVVPAASSSLSYQWYLQGYTSSSFVPLTDGVYYTGSLTAALTHSNLYAGESGSYQCLINNAFGNITSSVVNLTTT